MSTVVPSGRVTAPSWSTAVWALCVGRRRRGLRSVGPVQAAGEHRRHDGHHRHRRGDRGRCCRAAAAADAAGPATHVVQGERRVVEAVHAPVQLPAQRFGHGVLGAHRSSSRGFSVAGVRSRSAASARLVWDFTVPTEMPRTSAVSASVISS